MAVQIPASRAREMTEQNPRTVSYNFGLVDFGTGGLTTSIKAPPGRANGTIVDIGLAVTETFACDSTPGTIKIGTASDDDAYALMNVADGTAATDYFNVRNDTDAIIDPNVFDTQLEVVCAVGVDSGTEAGIGYLTIVIDWY